MKKSIFLILILVLTFCFVGLTNVNASFTSDVASLTSKKGTSLTKKAKTGSIPADYGYFGFFKLRKSSPSAEYKGYKTVPAKVKTAWKNYGTDKTPYTGTFASGVKPTIAKTGYSVCYPKVAIYNNKWIDVKGEVTGFEANTKKYSGNLKPTIAFYGNTSNGKVTVMLQAVNWATVKWSFTEYNAAAKSGAHCGGKAISVKGNTSYWDVDWQQGIHLKNNNKGLYISSKNNKLKYGSISSKTYVFDSANSDADNTKKNYAFTELFSGSSISRTYSFYRIKDKKARGGIGMAYNSVNKVTPPNPTKSESSTTLKEGAVQTYTVKQMIPLQDKSNYFKSVVLQDTLDNCFDMNNTTAEVRMVSDNKVVSGSGKYFTISKSGNTIKATATASALKTEAFYGEHYELVIKTKIENGYNFSKYEKNAKGYIVKNTGSSIIDKTTRNTPPVTSYYNPPKCVYQYYKYYDREGKMVTKEAYDYSCHDHCKKVGDKYYNNVGSEITREQYFEQCTTRTPLPDPVKNVDTESIRYNKEFHYTILQSVPYQPSSSHYKSFSISDELEQPLQVSNPNGIKIMQFNKAISEIKENEQGKDYTDKFEIKVEGQKVTATLKNPSDADFYGIMDNNDKEVIKTYVMILPVSLKNNASKLFDMSKYLNEGRYVIPDIAKVNIVKSDGTEENKDTNKVDVYYYEDPVPSKIASTEDVTSIAKNNGTYTYTIEKSVLGYKENQYYSSFVFKDTFEAPIKINSTSSLKIVDENNQDVTDWFDVTLNGQTLEAKLKAENNNSNFYGHIYKFIINVGINNKAELDKYEKDGKYVIPNKAQFTYDGDITIETNTVNVYMEIPSVPKVKKIKTPNTASPAVIGFIVFGLFGVLTGLYFILQSNGIKPFNKLNK